jgi:transcriptional regulator with XRE-family HTH domain
MLSPTHAALGNAVRRRRRELGESQEALASRAGLHRNYVGGVERGERNVSLTNLHRLAEALGMRASELVAESEGHALPPLSSRS